MIKDAGANKRESPGILRCHKCAKYREGGDARRLKRRKREKRAAIGRGRKPHELRLRLKIPKQEICRSRSRRADPFFSPNEEIEKKEN